MVVLLLGLLFLFPDWLTRESVAEFLQTLGPMAFLGYIVLCLTRAAVMIPATPFVLAGAISFPDSLIAVFVVSIIGIVVGALLIYSFPTFGSYDEYLEARYPKQIATIKRKMQSKYAYLFVMGWSFFPLVPTDVICYVAGLAKMSVRKLALAVVVGELPIVAFYIFVGAEISEWLRA